MTNKKKAMPVGKPFAKGDPRINRKGRKPLNQTFGEYVREFLEADNDGKKKSVIEEMTEVAVTLAKKGNYQFWDALTNRAYGKVPDKIEMQSEEKPDLSKLTNEEIEIWKQLLEKSKPSQS